MSREIVELVLRVLDQARRDPDVSDGADAFEALGLRA